MAKMPILAILRNDQIAIIISVMGTYQKSREKEPVEAAGLAILAVSIRCLKPPGQAHIYKICGPE